MVYTTTINNFVDCGFVITRYTHTLTHIHILPQNSCRWSLCKSANVGVAAGNIADKYLQEGPVRLPLWQWRSSPTEIDAHVAFLSSGDRKRNGMVRDQVSMEGVAAPLGQAQSDVQGCCHLAAASSSCAKAQDAYNELNCVDGEGSSCSGACLQSLLLGWIPCEQFQMSQKEFKHYLAFWPDLSWFLLSWRW
jgi:hypothetical protein